MSKKIRNLIIVAVVLVVVIGISTLVVGKLQEKKCREYEELLGGYSYSGYDSLTTSNHGKVGYHYTLRLYQDGSCELHFRSTRTGDTGRFPSTAPTSFTLTGIRWYVSCSGGKYEIFLSGGEWDWQDWSAAKISRYITITDNRKYGYGILLEGLRSGYYEFYFNRQSALD
jgi:hypothetical protein